MACVASLVGCGGGGTTGPLIAPDTARVKVAVVDSGFNIDDPEIRDRVHAWQVCTQQNLSTVQCGGSDIQDASNDPHGTYVAQVIAGRTVGHSDNAALLLAKASNLFTSEIESATQWAVDQGARVVNYSLYPMHEVDFYLDRTYAYARNHGVALVMSAGNGGTDNLGDNLSTYAYRSGTTSLFASAYADVALVVGAASQTGANTYSLTSYSNFPGNDPAVQARFLTALAPVNVVNSSGTTIAVNGTSFTAPQVTAALATLLAQWPHLTAQQSTQLLLDTANDRFTGYSAFYFGQGLLDLNTALQPVGTTALLTGASVEGSAFSVAGSGLTLPAAFGDALHGHTLTTAVFDGYGRDFRFNLRHLIRTTQSAGPRDWMASLGEHVHNVQHDQWQMRTAFGADGRLQSSHLAWGLGRGVQMHWQRGSGRGLDALANSESPLRSLSSEDALHPYAALDRLGLRWQLHPLTTVEVRTTLAQPGDAGGDASSASARRHEVLLAWQPSAGTRWSLGFAVTDERQALLGRSGQGALALDRSLAQAVRLRLDHKLAGQWRLFGAAEGGTLQMQGRTGYLQMDQATTSQWQTGLVWSDLDGRSQWALALSQPLRVEQATARFDLPVGRTLDGQVIRQRQTVSLAPSGRQLNLEMAWQRALGGRAGLPGTLGLHAIYAHDAGHQAGQRDWSLLGAYRLRW